MDLKIHRMIDLIENKCCAEVLGYFPLKKAQNNKFLQNVVGLVGLNLFMEGSGKCMLQSMPLLAPA